MFPAGLECLALEGKTCIAKNPDWQACHQVLIFRALLWEDAEDARLVMWK